MHVCFNALDYPSEQGGGGVGTQVAVLARALVEAGHRATVVALGQKGLPDYCEDRGVRVHRVRCGNRHWYLSRLPLVGRLLTLPVRELERSWAAYRKIAELHRDDPFDLIEGTETGMFWAARRLPVPFLIRLHGEPYTFARHTPGAPPSAGLRLCRVLQRRPLRRARLLVAPSRAHAEEVRRELGRPLPPLEVVPNVLGPMDEPAGRAGGLDGPVVLYVGRLERGKGVFNLLEAARRVQAELPGAHFVLAGARHPTLPQAELDEALGRLPYPERVHLLGHVPRAHLAGWYRRADVCVLPSHYETFGLAALEPMAFGVPVVASRAGGLPEVVADGVSGLLVGPGDAGELAAAVVALLADPERRRRLGENGRRAAGGFSVARHLPDNLRLYRRATGREAPARRLLLAAGGPAGGG